METTGRRVRQLVLVIGVLASMPTTEAAARRLECAGSFRRSCVRSLYRGFDGRGTCTRDVSRYLTEGRVIDCWANGAWASVTGFLGTDGAVEVHDRRGRRVLAGTTTEGQLAGALTVLYAKSRRRQWSLTRTVDGAWTITCPSGRVETHTAADVAESGCGPIAACALGPCPVGHLPAE